MSVNRTVRVPQPEHILEGRYRLIRRLGAGGMGLVFLAERLKLGTSVAIKFLDPVPHSDPTRPRRFLQEARVGIEVEHPGAAQLLDAGYDEQTQTLFLVFEYVEGRDVREVLNEEGRLSFEEAKDVCVQVAEVLAFAHQRNIVHRDIKPENVRMRRDVAGLRIKVLDFGIARLLNQARLTAEGTLAGTPRYMAPEQVKDGPVDARTDVYALGLLFFEMLTGTPAFNGKSLSQVLMQQVHDPVPSLVSVDRTLNHLGVDAFLKMACAKAADQRFQSMEAFVAALQRIESGGWPAPQRPLSSSEIITVPSRPSVSRGPASTDDTAVNPKQRDATVVTDERAGLETEPGRPPSVEVPWSQDESGLAHAKPIGGETVRADDHLAPAPTKRPSRATRAWVWFSAAGLLAAALSLWMVWKRR